MTLPADRSSAYLLGLLREFCKLPLETDWVEFKENNADPVEIGEYISALANSATLVGKPSAYVLWGVRDVDREVVGTRFDPSAAKVGNESLENWLLRLLSPKLQFRFLSVQHEGRHAVILEIEQAFRQPVQFQGVEFIRVGSHKKKLKDPPQKEALLWRAFDTVPFERAVARQNVPDDDVPKLLWYPSYFDLLERPLPTDRKTLLADLQGDDLIRPCEAGGWDITNLGAILFAKDLNDFPRLARKAVRVVQYRRNDRVETVKEQMGARGYAAGFEELIGYVNGLLPSNEVVSQAIRRTVPVFPELAVRELVANALIHQDLTISGAGPMIELFEDRVEITNPGASLVEVERFVDSPPRSRNEALASLMRRMGICEERGSGWDKVVAQTELFQLRAPLAETIGDSTRVTLLSPRPLGEMDKDERVNAVYWHAVLRYVNRQPLTNTSLRERFKIEPHNSASASRLIREAVEAGRIIPYDPDAAPKLMKYQPFWAASAKFGREPGT